MLGAENIGVKAVAQAASAVEDVGSSLVEPAGAMFKEDFSFLLSRLCACGKLNFPDNLSGNPSRQKSSTRSLTFLVESFCNV